jgi:hypothetical protein
MSCCDEVEVGKYCADCGKKKQETRSIQQQLDVFLNGFINLGNCNLIISFVDRSTVDHVCENKIFHPKEGRSWINIRREILIKYGFVHGAITLSQKVEGDGMLKYDLETDRTKIFIRKTIENETDKRTGKLLRGAMSEKGYNCPDIFEKARDCDGRKLYYNNFLEDIRITNFCVRSLETLDNFLKIAIKNKINRPTYVVRLDPDGFDCGRYKMNEIEQCRTPDNMAIEEKQRRLERLIGTLSSCFGTIYLIDGKFFCREQLEIDTKNGEFSFDWELIGRNVFKIFDLNVAIVDDDVANLLKIFSTVLRGSRERLITPKYGYTGCVLRQMFCLKDG